uniref:Uncharacterized protein n=1 Tax=Anguilla anguilla TaxID=7936 RepID=A0A0E9TES5_ANGAN
MVWDLAVRCKYLNYVIIHYAVKWILLYEATLFAYLCRLN